MDTTTYDISGTPITLPVIVGRAQQAAATFRAPYDNAASMISASGLVPKRMPGNNAMVSIALVKYLENDLGVYDELALAVVVEPHSDAPPLGKRAISTLIHRLPVNGEFTCEAGQQIWGFPKWVADMSVEFTDNGALGVLLNDDGTEFLRVEMKKGRLPMPRKRMDMAAYSFGNDDVLRVTPWTTDGIGKPRVRPGGTTVTIGSGHSFAQELADLNMNSSSMMTMFDPHMTAVFNGPTEL